MNRRSIASRGSLLLAVVLTSGPGLAVANQDLVIESYAGTRPGEADPILDPVVVALTQKGFAAPSSSANLVIEKVSSPTILLTEAELDGATKFIESAYNQYQLGEFKATLRDVAPGLAALEKGPATLVRLPAYRELRQKGLIAAALAHKRLGNAALAERAAAELVRGYPDRPIDTSIFSPEAVELVTRVRDKLTAGASATLTIETDTPTAAIYIDEVYAGVGRVEKKDLPVGEYRIILQLGDRLGRLHRVRVGEGERRVVPLSWGLDRALHTDGQRVVLSFESDADRAEREGEFALALAREVGAQRVAVLGIRRRESGRAVFGTLYAATRKTPDGAWVAAEPTLPTREALTALGAYLAGDKSGVDLLEPLDGSAADSDRDAPGDRGDGSSPTLGARLLVIATLGSGAIGIATGAALILLHEPEFDDSGNRNPEARDTRLPGIVAASAGVVLAGVGVYLLLRAGPAEKDEPVAARWHLEPVRGGGVVGVSGSF